ncbi:alpha/beta hydrolase family protein [Shouchella patagoniensis]|uniref:alpha/beta hydrolase family protein n=1 Tax=Shouchella patagoniensis TaxID=228576 RepID=UPI0009957857|nr:prolyl oligopeptidase family serine peptidase [Shouchella patagoniensis]
MKKLGNRISEHHDLAQAANPLTYITEDAPPFLILHGDQDKVVPKSQSELLYNALRERGNEAQLHIIEGAGHATLEFYQPEVKRIINDFFDENLNKTAKGKKGSMICLSFLF